ncbi:MAG TPA: nucleoside deaminase [Firmicutes bacterium]|uniref:tRNA-specific adenosine deaminase n=1 Tax=Capillibacterium thermochitinicola TaxID=2699427 RepID=A0A8J6LSY6_9FIRM|nr:tRNA adenosine(34) deaminase TadA [Capillibacterium thermochitinicola]MBA2133697.1 nucleoside deaminase [Capillibacterium thermochitinicola]HHW11861.1 nucleoside deaminase [Bacillota bacterium]
MEAIDRKFMEEALREAEKALARDEVPIGAVVVYQGEVFARGHNLRESLGDPTAHAEILALRAAAARRGSWRLHGMTLYVTLEPCPMCAGAMVNARLDRLVFGAFDPKAGAAGSLMNIANDGRLNHRLEVTGGVLAEPAGRLLTDFFRRKREFPGKET